MRVIVDYERCEANGLCVAAAPEVFALDDDDQLHLVQAEPAEALRAQVLEAVRRCPRLALRVED